MLCLLATLFQSDFRMKVSKKVSKKSTLRLVVESEAVPKKRRGLHRFPRLEVRDKKVQGFVHGQRCSIVFDSGSEESWMHLSEAERLGLITGTEEKVTKELSLWNGQQEVEVIQLPEVVFTLEGGVTVRTPMVVFPRALEELYDPRDIVLDISSLRRGGVVQTFNRKGAALFVRHPERLREPPGQG